jgi:GNAT superfamily N-acetyltransferase
MMQDTQKSIGRVVMWQTPAEMRLGFSVISQMYPTLSLEQYQERLEAFKDCDYRQFAYLNEQSQCLGVVGLWFIPRLWCGLQADIDNFVVDQESRSLGIGKLLLERCLEYAVARGADLATLDTFVDNPNSHRFYFREGFSIRGYHFVKPLQGQDIWNTP